MSVIIIIIIIIKQSFWLEVILPEYTILSTELIQMSVDTVIGDGRSSLTTCVLVRRPRQTSLMSSWVLLERRLSPCFTLFTRWATTDSAAGQWNTIAYLRCENVVFIVPQQLRFKSGGLCHLGHYRSESTKAGSLKQMTVLANCHGALLIAASNNRNVICSVS